MRWAWLDWGLSGWLTTLLQCFDTVGWVIRPVKTVGRITYTVLVQTLNHAQSIEHIYSCRLRVWSLRVWSVWLTAYDYSPSDGTDGPLDEAEATPPSAHEASKPRKKRILRASRKKHDASPLTEWNNAVPRNLSADAVRARLSLSVRNYIIHTQTYCQPGKSQQIGYK